MQNNELMFFNCEEFGEVRALSINGEPLVVAKDIATALGYSNPQKAVRDHCKNARPIGVNESFTLDPQTVIIPESDIYRLIIRSTLPNAESFERKVMEEILPTIRRTGGYVVAGVNETPEAILARAVLVAQDTIKRIEAKARELEHQIETDRPKVIFADSVAASPGCILIRELAKYLKQRGINIGEKRLYSHLRENGYLIKKGSDYNLPTQRSMDLGLFEIKKWSFTHSDGHIETKSTTKVTGKGQTYFVNRFLGKTATD